MIGTQIANYRIEEKLGEGGMGVVYKAIDVNLDRTVAIKVLNSDLSRDPALLERFRAEAKAQAHLNHTNIASLFTLLTVDGTTSIVMEYLQGETFDQMLRRRGLLPWEEAVPLFRQALLGIGYAHRMGIVHRDIKPSNIMVNRHGIVKVMDFGIAKVLGGQRLTRTGAQVGTVAYMSPEQIRNRPVDIRSDIYSLGATLYELLTAHLPFEAESEFQVMSDHVSTPPPPPTRYYPYVPRGIEQCVLKALQKDPDTRFQTVEDFGAALEHPNGIEAWAAARAQTTPLPGAPPPLAGTVMVPAGYATPPPGYQTPPPTSQTPPPVYQTPPPGYQTPPPVFPSAAYVTPPPISPAPKPWHKNTALVAGLAAVLLLALGLGGYEVLKPKPKPIVTDGGSGGGGTLLTDTGSAHQQAKTSDALKATSPILQGGGSDLNIPPPTQPGPSNNGGKDTAPPGTPTPGPTPAPKPPVSTESPSLKMMQNAARALNGGRLFRPRNNSAFYWAKEAEQNGNPQAPMLERAILQTALVQVQRLRTSGDYSAASALLGDAIDAYPDRSDLASLRQQILAQQQMAQQQMPPPQVQQTVPVPQPAPQTMPRPQPQLQAARFAVQHRHAEFGGDRLARYCVGFLMILPNGTVRYDCMQSQDRRCDHVSFAVADIKQVKITGQGSLHIATRGMGNWDFFGPQVENAMQALSRAIAAAH